MRWCHHLCFLSLLALVLVCAIAGCGKKGPLFLPDEAKPPAQQPTPPAK